WSSGRCSCRWHGYLSQPALDAVGGWRILCSMVALLTHQAPLLAPSTKAFRLRLVFRARRSASHGLERSMSPLLLAIYQLITHWKLSSVSQKSILLVYFEIA